MSRCYVFLISDHLDEMVEDILILILVLTPGIPVLPVGALG